MNTSNKIYKDIDSLMPQVESWRSKGEKIVFTNGCFDLLHLGHVDYLEKARNLGQVLIVGLNTDESVKGNKGESRPITDEVSRARVLASLAFVDAVVYFGEDTPLGLIKRIMPDILVKGKDYTVSNIVGADVVLSNKGKVETIELVEGYSTSKIVAKILGGKKN